MSDAELAVDEGELVGDLIGSAGGRLDALLWLVGR